MKAKRESAHNYNEAMSMALNYIHCYCEDKKVQMQDITCDCCNFDTPREISQWSGTTSGLAVIDCNNWDILYEVAYMD